VIAIPVDDRETRETDSVELRGSRG
jgi:hypothetical protein